MPELARPWSLSIPFVLAALACRSDRDASPDPDPWPRIQSEGAVSALSNGSPAVAVAGPGSRQGEERPSRTIPASPGGQPRLELVARFEHQVTGVAATEDGRLFVAFPRWTEDSEISVAELGPRGKLTPYPDELWNAWRNAKKDRLSPEDHWVCAQSVVADGRGSLWVLDPAAPAIQRRVPGGPKLVRIDLATDRVEQTIPFDETVAPEGSYLNDVRFSPDGSWAYVTDSGARGALVVVDLASGRARRVLDGHPSTQVEKDVTIEVDGREVRTPDGRKLEAAADGIALAPDGEQLYWQAMTGETLYRIRTDALRDESLSGDELGRRVERVGRNGVADGLWIDDSRRMYVTAPEEHAIKVRHGERLEILIRSDELRWPDSLARGPGETLYVTASRIHEMAWFRPENGPRLATSLLLVRLAPTPIEASSPDER